MTKNKNRAKLSFILCLALVLSLFAGVVSPVEAYAEGGNVIASLDMQINWNNMTAFEDLDEEGVKLPASAFSFNSEYVEPAGGFWMYKIGDEWNVITSSEIIETLEPGTPIGIFVHGIYNNSYVLTENSAISCNDFELFDQAFSEDYFELGFNLGTKAEVEELIASGNSGGGQNPEGGVVEDFIEFTFDDSKFPLFYGQRDSMLNDDQVEAAFVTGDDRVHFWDSHAGDYFDSYVTGLKVFKKSGESYTEISQRNFLQIGDEIYLQVIAWAKNNDIDFTNTKIKVNGEAVDVVGINHRADDWDTITFRFKLGNVLAKIAVDENIVGGTVTVNKTTAELGEAVTVTATPAPGYVLSKIVYSDKWGDGGIAIEGNTFEVPRYDVLVSAKFVSENIVTIDRLDINLDKAAESLEAGDFFCEDYIPFSVSQSGVTSKYSGWLIKVTEEHYNNGYVTEPSYVGQWRALYDFTRAPELTENDTFVLYSAVEVDGVNYQFADTIVNASNFDNFYHGGNYIEFEIEVGTLADIRAAQNAGGPAVDPTPDLGSININVSALPTLVVGEALPDISSITATTNVPDLLKDDDIEWVVKFTQKYIDIARAEYGDSYVNFEEEIEQVTGGWLPMYVLESLLESLLEDPYVVNNEDTYGIMVPLFNHDEEFIESEYGYGYGAYTGQISSSIGKKAYAFAEGPGLDVYIELGKLGGGQQTPSRPSSRPSSKPSSSTETPTVTVPVSNNENKVNVEASVKDNEATIKPLDQKEINQIVGDDKAAGDVVIDVTGLNKDVDGVGIPKETLDAIVDAAEDAGNDTEHLVIKMSTATLTFDDKAMRAIAEQAEGDVVEFHFDDVNTSRLNSAQKDAVKDMDIRKGFEAYITVNGNRVSDFRGGTAEIVVPYAVPTGENIKAFSVWFIAEDGTPEKVKSTYDGVNKWFTVSHFSDYVIAYDEADVAGYNVCPKDDSCIIVNFSDAQANAWYHDGVHYCLDHGIMTGYENGTFGPAKQTTRAHVVQMLYSLEGTPSYTHADKFTDVSEDAWYHDAVLWAEENNIVAGTSATKFAPNKAITREQMVAILYRYAQYKGYDVSVGLETNILSYADASEVAEYAIPAMQWACGAGIVTGVEKNGTAYLAPKGDAVRSQTATMFFNLCEKMAK